MKRLFLPLFFVLVQLAYAQEFDKARMDTYLQLLEKHNKASLTVAVSKGNELIYQGHAGYLTSAKTSRIDGQTQFRVGSITKTFTSVVCFQLIEEGKLSLDTKLSEFFPTIKNAERINIGHLLRHRSGIQSFTNTPHHLATNTKETSREQLLELMEAMESEFEPGTNYRYSNSGYTLLGLIIEKITGKTYEENVKTRIVDKLGLTRTEYGGKIDPEDNEASSLTFQMNSWIPLPFETHMSVPFAAGAMVSTAADLNRFMYALFNGQLVSESSLKQMKQFKQNMGYGIFPIPFYRHAGIGHNGKLDSFDSSSSYFADEDLNITVLANGLTIGFNDILIHVMNICFGRDFELPNYDAQPIALDPTLLPAYEGTFAAPGFPMKITISSNGKRLIAQATGQGPIALTAYTKRDFRFNSAGIVMIFGEKNGKVDHSTFVLKQGGNQHKFTRE